ncbi:MAG: hypothetical protein R3D69_11630 [Xanthobacteraceae bacterium]
MSEALMDPKLRFVLAYTAGIAILVFVINRVALGTPTQTSFMWSALFAAIAFAMAWRQASQKKKP